MKIPLEIIDENLSEKHYIRYSEHTYRTVSELIAKAQKDAWNSALEWAAENAEYETDGQEHIEKVWIDKQSILKGKIEE